jgi:hypothetical protein
MSVACGRPLPVADATSESDIETESGDQTQSESDGESESESESETDTEETDTEETETETETGDACDACEGAREIAEGIVECADGRINRVASGTFDPTISADPCTGNEDVIECSTDADCNSGPYGKCIHSLESGFPPKTVCGCAYSCSTDDDCAEGSVCVPSGVLWGIFSDPPHWPQCVPADCENNSDCSECGECGMGRTLTLGDCYELYAIQCRTADDICSSSEECKGGLCYPDSDGTWVCDQIRCI